MTNNWYSGNTPSLSQTKAESLRLKNRFNKNRTDKNWLLYEKQRAAKLVSAQSNK